MDILEVETLRRLLREQIKARGLFYLEIFRTMTEKFGQEAAEETMREAIYRRGIDVSKRFSAFAPHDLAGLKTAFLNFVPDAEHTFQPKVIEESADTLEIHLTSCPMRDCWHDAGLSADEVATLCRLAGEVDCGTFEGAGFTIENETWHPGRQDTSCCRLRIHPSSLSEQT